MKNKFKILLKSKLVKNSIWLTILQLMNTLIPMLTIPYVTRILGTEEYGIFSIALNWILYFQVLVEFGFGLTGARNTAIIDDHESLQTLFNNILSARIILFLLSFLLMNIIFFISGIDIKTYICMLLLYIMIIGTTFQLTWLFQGKQDMKFITIINSVSRIISIMLIFLFVKSKSDIYLYCILYSVTVFLSSLISMFIAYTKYNLRFKFANIDDILLELNDGKYIFASSAIAKIFSGIGITILGIVSTNSIVGIYSAIYKIPYALTMIFLPISQALFPHISTKFKNSYSEGIESVKKICMPVFFVYFTIAIIMIIFRNHVVLLLFGKEYEKFSIIVIPLVIQFIFAVINNFFGIQIFVASGNQKKYSKAFILSCIIMIILNVTLGYRFDIYGVSISACLGEVALSFLLYYQFRILSREQTCCEKAYKI